jgi:hypothetical protein
MPNQRILGEHHSPISRPWAIRSPASAAAMRRQSKDPHINSALLAPRSWTAKPMPKPNRLAEAKFDQRILRELGACSKPEGRSRHSRGPVRVDQRTPKDEPRRTSEA